MVDSSLPRVEIHHFRTAWIWAAFILGLAVLVVASGLAAQFANQDTWDADSGTVKMIGP
jgi:hypothetical protein